MPVVGEKSAGINSASHRRQRRFQIYGTVRSPPNVELTSGGIRSGARVCAYARLRIDVRREVCRVQALERGIHGGACARERATSDRRQGENCGSHGHAWSSIIATGTDAGEKSAEFKLARTGRWHISARCSQAPRTRFARTGLIAHRCDGHRPRREVCRIQARGDAGRGSRRCEPAVPRIGPV